MANALQKRTLAADTTITVVGPIQNAPNGGVLLVDAEQIFFGHATDTLYLDCVRGFNGTVAADHEAGAVATDITDNPQSTIVELRGVDAPVDGITGVSIASTGSRYTRTFNGTLFINTGTITEPVWELVASGTDDGITELTGDVTAGPGNGSQVATLADTAVTPGAYTNANVTIDSKGRVTAAASGSNTLPGGNDRSIQFNDSGAFGGSDALKFLNDEEVAVLGINKSNISLNHDTEDNLFFNNSDQSVTFGKIQHDGSELRIQNDVGNIKVLSPTGKVSVTTNYTFDEATGNIDAPGTGEFRFINPINMEGNGISGILTLGVSGLSTLSELSLGGNIAHDFGELAIGSSLADPSAILDVVSTSRGFAMPRMTTVQRDAISSPVTGLQIYDTDTNLVAVYNGTSWVEGAAAPGNPGEVFFNDGAGGFAASSRLTFDPGGTNAVLRVHEGPFNGQSAVVQINSDNGQAGNALWFSVGDTPQSSIGRPGNGSGLDYSSPQHRFSGPIDSIDNVTLHGALAMTPPNTMDSIFFDMNDPVAGTVAELRAFYDGSNKRLDFTGILNLVRMDFTEGSVVVGGASNDITVEPSAALSINGTTKGFLPPKLTDTERDAIATPAAGLMIYNTTTNKLNFYNGTVWRQLDDSAV